jgi:predicted dienelactone hydrolase
LDRIQEAENPNECICKKGTIFMPNKFIKTTRKNLLLCLTATMLVCGSLYGMKGNLADPGQLGPYSVGHTSFVLTDASRMSSDAWIPFPIFRPIPVHVFYPVDPASINESTPEAVYPIDMIHLNFDPYRMYSSEWEQQGIDPAYQQPPASADGPFPLVLYSQGWGAPAWNSLYVGTRLASHGFVVALVYHYGDGHMSQFYEPIDNIAVASMNRPLDISFTLSKLLERNDNASDLMYKLIDPEKVAASGWSLGGYAAMALAGGDDLVCDKPIELGVPGVPISTCVPSPPDPRIRAIVPLDGSTQLLRFDELARITVPTMGMGEEWSTLAANSPPGWESWQARLHAASQGHPAYRVDVQGTFHSTFSNSCESLPIFLNRGIITPDIYQIFYNAWCGAPLPTTEAHRLVTKYMIAFLKTNLAGKSGYQPILTPGYALKNESMIEFFVTEKRNPHAIDADWPGDFVYFMHQSGSEQSKAAKDPKPSLPVDYVGHKFE